MQALDAAEVQRPEEGTGVLCVVPCELQLVDDQPAGKLGELKHTGDQLDFCVSLIIETKSER